MYKVFIVDDEPFILEGLPYAIEWEQFHLEIAGQAEDGRQALEALKSKPADILITDITMPVMNGLELIREMKKLNPQMKFIILSGYHEFDYVKQGITLGIENYLLKPINVEELKETVKNTVRKLDDALRKEWIGQSRFDVLRDNILYRWVTGGIGAPELKDRSKLLGFPIAAPYYTVFTMKPVFADMFAEPSTTAGINAGTGDYETGSNDKPGWAGVPDPSALPPYLFRKDRVIAAMYQYCRETIGDGGECVCFCDADGDIVIIAASQSPHPEQAPRYRLIRQLRTDMERLWKVRIIATTGSTEPSFANVSRSYDSAKNMQEYDLVNHDEEWLDYGLLHGAADSAAARIDLQTYEKLLLAKDKDAVLAWIDALFRRLSVPGTATPSQIHNAAIEMMIRAKHFAKDMNMSNELISNDYKQLFSKLFKVRTLEQLNEHVKYIAGAAVDCMAEEDGKLSPVVRQVLQHISDHYAEELSLKTLGQAFRISPGYLGQLFKKETNVAFSDYLNKFRMETAKKLLMNTRLTTSDIAQRVGYVDASYFYRQFKKHFGISPSELRSMR
ncbi:Regulator of RpoS [Paenibacillus sp. CECT 9249]|uniref:response regulator transcription factor n=1 Tax=Paenibacillus sp. CECT 9249 TaxID=2845385 RepID=UPI001E5D176A|nr:response regulator transcription factor [Paenibacillus sp. CECT 9249]CAH0118151.1 Regulator of RpoS [Paenibacillus sp. CECT 9249]